MLEKSPVRNCSGVRIFESLAEIPAGTSYGKQNHIHTFTLARPCDDSPSPRRSVLAPARSGVPQDAGSLPPPSECSDS